MGLLRNPRFWVCCLTARRRGSPQALRPAIHGADGSLARSRYTGQPGFTMVGYPAAFVCDCTVIACQLICLAGGWGYSGVLPDEVGIIRLGWLLGAGVLIISLPPIPPCSL
ncbi:MAG: hypothetical protein GX577_09340 [Leptolinea sp.]|nr:hypothetical protein [Leptolinea sp.]